MKFRIAFTVITMFLGWVAQSVYHMLYSPITGVATAQSLNDDSGAGYAAAKFIREGNVPPLIFGLTLIVLVLIWLGPICNLFKQNKN